MAGATSIGTTIVEQNAAREGVDPQTLVTTLYDVADADALQAATNDTGDRQPSAHPRIGSTYDGYPVIEGEGLVTIR